MADLVSRILRVDRPPFWQSSPQEVRAFYEKASGILDIPAAPVAATRDLRIPVGKDDIAARLYVGTDAPEDSPLIVFAHGGGFTIGSIGSYDAICRMLANGLPGRVLSLDYRLAPEHRFPTAADDVLAACQWAQVHAKALGADPHRIVGMGDSAGGTLISQAALRMRDAGQPLAAQVLVYPGTCAWQDTPSHAAYAEGYLLDARTVQWFFGNYLRDDADRLDWRFAVLDAPELAGLGPTLLQVAECDPLCDEGIAFAARLQASRVAVDFRLYEGVVHGFYNMGQAIPQARDAHRDTLSWLRERVG